MNQVFPIAHVSVFVIRGLRKGVEAVSRLGGGGKREVEAMRRLAVGRGGRW